MLKQKSEPLMTIKRASTWVSNFVSNLATSAQRRVSPRLTTKRLTDRADDNEEIDTQSKTQSSMSSVVSSSETCDGLSPFKRPVFSIESSTENLENSQLQPCVTTSPKSNPVFLRSNPEIAISIHLTESTPVPSPLSPVPPVCYTQGPSIHSSISPSRHADACPSVSHEFFCCDKHVINGATSCDTCTSGQLTTISETVDNVNSSCAMCTSTNKKTKGENSLVELDQGQESNPLNTFEPSKLTRIPDDDFTFSEPVCDSRDIQPPSAEKPKCNCRNKRNYGQDEYPQTPSSNNLSGNIEIGSKIHSDPFPFSDLKTCPYHKTDDSVQIDSNCNSTYKTNHTATNSTTNEKKVVSKVDSKYDKRTSICSKTSEERYNLAPRRDSSWMWSGSAPRQGDSSITRVLSEPWTCGVRTTRPRSASAVSSLSTSLFAAGARSRRPTQASTQTIINTVKV